MRIRVERFDTVAAIFERAAARVQKQGHGRWASSPSGFDDRPGDYKKGPLMALDALWFEAGMSWHGLYPHVSDLWLGLTGYAYEGAYGEPEEGDHMVDVDESINKAQAVEALKACARIARMMETK